MIETRSWVRPKGRVGMPLALGCVWATTCSASDAASAEPKSEWKKSRRDDSGCCMDALLWSNYSTTRKRQAEHSAVKSRTSVTFSSPRTSFTIAFDLAAGYFANRHTVES